MNDTPRNSLGKGLAALLGEDSLSEAQMARQTLSVDQIIPDKNQPRKNFDPERMRDLVESIRRKGVLQPILVRELAVNSFTIVAGERRWRAAKYIGLERIPVVLLRCDEREALEIGLIENLQRDDLNPMEEAEAILTLQTKFQLTQERIAASIGKSRSHVANILRLNELSSKIKESLRAGQLSAGHARSLLTAENAETLADEVVRDNLSVRALEKKLKDRKESAKQASAGKNYGQYQSSIDFDIQAVTKQLAEAINMRVELTINGQSGNLNIRFQKLEQLDWLLCRLQSQAGIKV